MSYKKQIPHPAGVLVYVVCWCALAWPLSAGTPNSGAAAAPQATAPSLLSIPSPAEQLRPLPNPDSSATPATDSGSTPSSTGSTTTSSQPSDADQGTGSPQAPSVAVAADSTTVPPSVGPPPDSSTALAPASPPPAADPSSNAWKNSYVNLINLLVNRGVLTKKDSGDLISQAEHDASAAANSTQAQAAPASASPATPAHPDDDTMRVGYVPEAVKEQMRDEIKQDVMQQARDEHWAAPDTTPDWVHRYHVTADIRVRYQGQYYPSGNDDTGDFHNFNAINTGSPFDVGSASVAQNPPYYNVNQDRDQFRLRARIGADIDVGAGFTAGMRIATGSDNSPVTENQTLGGANNGQGGDFSKYSIWLDRAFLKYQYGGTPQEDFSATIGRFDNPFFSSSMIWASDIGFDGLVARGRYQIADGVTPFLTAGAFPVFNTDLNFGTYNPSKFSSEDKWLYAAQAGGDWKISHDFSFKGAVAYYDFENVEGKVSDPFTPQFSTDSGNTDDSRPSFAQNGNTYIALRDIVPNASNDFGTINQWQYFGLATPFHELALTGQLDYSGFDPLHFSLLGEFVKNLAFDRTAIENNGPPQFRGPVNNLSGGSSGTFDGGDSGYNIRLTAGAATLEKLWDWNVNLTYRYVESDAVVDGFTDSDFGGALTGTNLKGYIIGGNLALTSRVWTTLRWMSADAIAGPTYKSNLIQLDINAKF